MAKLSHGPLIAARDDRSSHTWKYFRLLTCSILPFLHRSLGCRLYVASHEFPLCPPVSVVNCMKFHEAYLLICSTQLPIQWNIPLTNY